MYARTNKYESLPLYPLVEKDLSIIVDNTTTWDMIVETVKKRVKSVEFVSEYRGNQIPENKKSITLRVKIGNNDSTMTSDQITEVMNGIVRALENRCGASIREA